MTAYTSPDNLPAPNDYQQPADSPAAFKALADATQTALTARAAASHTHTPASLGAAAASHTHTAAQAGVAASVHGPYTLAGNGDATYTVAHRLGRQPVAVVVTATDDDGAASIMTTTGGYDATNVTIRALNIQGAAEQFRLCVIAV